jgi:N,N'-diacetyllegionaminate synthase
MDRVFFGSRAIGRGAPVLVIAEAGVNHNGDLRIAHQLIDCAANAGADVVKFQSFAAEDIVTPSAPKANYQRATTGLLESQFQMLKRLELSDRDHSELQKHCAEEEIIFLSTPYSEKSLRMLDSLGVLGYKISSSDTTNLPLLDHVARHHKPVILSTGMCDLAEVRAAVDALREAGLEQFALLHCTSEYPAPLDELNLRVIENLHSEFECPVGFSDHTVGTIAAAWAVAAGACIIEKHFTMDRNLPGPDHRASLEPNELAELVRVIRQTERSLGDGQKRPTPSELKNKQFMQKSIVARRAIAQAETIEAEAITCKRPASGLPPRFWNDVVGRRAARAIAQDEVLTMDSVLWE